MYLNSTAMKRKLIIFLLVTMTMSLVSSKKEADDSSVTDLTDPEMSEEDIAVMDSISTIPMYDSILALPDGQNVKDYLLQNDPDFYYNWENQSIKKNLVGSYNAQTMLIAKSEYVAWNLAQRQRYNVPYEGPDKPAHYGLAYCTDQNNIRNGQSLRQDSARPKYTGWIVQAMFPIYLTLAVYL